MMDESSILTTLARRAVTASKEPAKESLDQSSFFRAIAEANRRVKEAEAARDAIVEGANREHEQHKQEMAAMQARLDTLTAECAQYKARCEVAEKRPPEVRYEQNQADESLRVENVSLRVECASYKATCDELRNSVARLEAQLAQKPEAEEVEDDGEDDAEGVVPINYDIDVVRSGDNLIRTLKLRVAP